MTPAIHKGCINLETWKVDVATSIENASWLDDPNLSDSYVSANCELEMTVAEARSLAEAILEALESLES